MFLAKAGKFFHILTKGSARSLLGKIEGSQGWERPNVVDALRLKIPYPQRVVRSELRRLAQSSLQIRHLSGALKRAVSGPFEYINVGHTDLEDSVFDSLSIAGAQTLRVMIHDMIPLDFPEFTRKGQTEVFDRRVRAVARHADEVICNSVYTKQRVQHYFDRWNSAPKYTVAHLGVESLDPAEAKNRAVERPFFVVLGTIEPRKNHRLLFSVWKKLFTELGKECPYLFVIGPRGWDNSEVFEFLENSPLVGQVIFEMNDVSDPELAGMLAQSNGLLFPSFVEGYGLPALEAINMGVPVLCSDIDVFRELIGETGTFLDPSDVSAWLKPIKNLVLENYQEPEVSNKSQVVTNIFTWCTHFGHVFK